METEELTGRATYSPEDNKLRLYVGRVPRDEYERLRAEGWTSTPKQGCDFVATWTPSRRDTALEYAAIIEDEDQGPAERAADRAERFAGYREKRTDEAVGRADAYDAGPTAHGYQNQARAERSARRHDRIAARACDAWSKAEYWQQRTVGVISHALYVSAPGVRMGRIKTLEAELRKALATISENKAHWVAWTKIAAIEDPAKQTAIALAYSGGAHCWARYLHPRPETAREYYKTNETSLYSLLSCEISPITGAEAVALFFSDHQEPADGNDWTQHYELRIAYENQMLTAQGGRLEQFEVLPGGKLGSRLILKVSKSSVTKRATSADILGPKVNGWTYKASNIPGTEWAAYKFDLERLSPDEYTPPTPESLAELEVIKATIKANDQTVTIPLVNPIDAEAERLQAVWNNSSEKREPKTVERMTQAEYSANSKGEYSPFETVRVTGGGIPQHSGGHMSTPKFPSVVKVRSHSGRVVIITDKPQKAFPPKVWNDPRPAVVAEVKASFEVLIQSIQVAWLDRMSEEEKTIFDKARSVGIAYALSMSQYGLTDLGKRIAEELKPLATA